MSGHEPGPVPPPSTTTGRCRKIRTVQAGTAPSRNITINSGDTRPVIHASREATTRIGDQMSGVIWLTEPEEHDYPAAGDYLGLIAGPHLVALLVDGLRQTETVHRKAKDILRSSGLPLLHADNAHVASNLNKIRKAQALSPILLVRGDITAGRVAQIADGYHRVCASYHTDENTAIPCRIVDLPPGH